MDEPLMPLDILAKNASKEALEKWRSAVKRSRLVVNFVKRREALKKIRNTEDNLRFAFNAYKVAFRFLNAVGQSESKQAQAAREASSEDEPLEEVGRAALEDELSDEARETGFNIHPDKLASMDNLRFAFNAYKVAFRFLDAVGQSESKQAQAAREASSEDELSDEARETGFNIHPDKLASMVRNRDIESLTFFGGVEGLASSVKVSLNEGVKKSDVAIRQKFYGFNRYSEKPSRSFWMFVWDALQDLNHTIFMVCAVVSIVVGLATKGWTKGMYDGLGIVLSIFLVILVTAVGDYKQSLQFQDLGKEKKRIFIEVTRDECIKKVSIYDLVVGDVVRLSMGDQVPADGILISGQNLLVDESSLSGKSVPLNKHKKKPFLLAGTKVQDGLGKMLVTTVGMRTEWGKMMMTLSEGGEDDTLLQGKLNGIATNIGKIGWVFAVLTFMELTVRFLVEKALHKKFRDWSSRDALTILNYFTGTVAPEGLPLAVTLTIAFAIKKLMNEKARVRLLCASEKMGSECSRPEVCIKTPEYLKEMIPIMYEEQVRNTDATRQEQIDIASSEEEVDGVTSDGTNDVPAVHEADIGLAGDIGGTEDAKENADVIKVDANSTTLVEVGKWGPAVYANIQKFVQFRLTVNVVALMINFLSTCISGSGPLTVVQLLWVNLIMNTLGALALATPPLNEELMNRSPVRRNVSFITKAMWRNIIGQIIYQLAVLLVLNYDGKQLLRLKGSNAAAILKTFIFNTFVFCQVFNEINSRGIEKINILRSMFSSWIFIGVVVSSVVLQVIIVEFVGTVVGSVPLRWQLWLISILIGAVSMPVALVLKCIAKRHNHYRPQPCSGPELV